MLIRTFRLGLLLLLATLAGCSGATRIDGPDAAGYVPQALLSQLPGVAQLRAASALVDYWQPGKNTYARDLNAWDEGDSLRMASSSVGFLWGIWGFGNAFNATNCRIDFSGDGGAEAYFAIADFDRGTWEIGGPLSGPQVELAIDKPGYISGAGDLFVAVFAYDGASVLVDDLYLTVDLGTVALPIDNSGGYTSMTIVNGNPAISFYADGDHDLCFVRATDNWGTSWGSTQILDSTGDTGQWTSLTLVDGYPAIAYYNFTTKVLRYVRAQDEDGTAWGTPLTVDAGPTVGEYCSLAVVDGNPAISYYDAGTPALRYIRATDATGATWGGPQLLDTSGNVGQSTSLEVINGIPAISYRNGGAGELYYIHAMDATGATWDGPALLDTGNTGFSSSLVQVNGYPAIAYYDSSAGELRYVRAQDSLGDTWQLPLTLAGVDDGSGDYCSMAVVNGYPAITYYNVSNGDLRYIQSIDANGDSWAAEVVLDDTSVVTGKDTCLIDLYGAPAVSYYDQTNGMLRYMWGFSGL
jgi:hypothetical protein